MTVMTDATSSQRQNLVKVKNIPGWWAEKTGGEVEADVADAWDGGQLQPDKLASPATTGNIVVRRPYKPRRDGSMSSQLEPLVGYYRDTLSVQDTDAGLRPVGRPRVYADALLVALRPPDYDASSGDAQVIELEWAVRGTAR